MGLLSSIFSGSGARTKSTASDKVQAEVYRVDMSGNQLVFHIPQTYCLELLTDPVTPSINLFRDYDRPASTLVAQRWWDFDRKKFFGKENLGHMVVTVLVRHQAAQESSDFFLRNELISYIYDELLERYQEKAEHEWQYGDPQSVISASNHPGHYKAKRINDNNWIFYTLVGPEMTGVYVLPITKKIYLEFSFTRYFSPRLARSDWYQVYDPAQVLEDRIMNKVVIDYTGGEPIGRLSDDPTESSYQPLTLPPFIRPEGYSGRDGKCRVSARPIADEMNDK